MKEKISIGLMSGTSMDGIDAVIIKTDGQNKISVLTQGKAKLNYDPRFCQLLRSIEYSVRKYKGDVSIARDQYSLIEFLRLSLKDRNIDEIADNLETYLNIKGKIAFDDIVKYSTDLHSQIVIELLKKSGKKSSEIDLIGYHGQTLYHDPANGITVQVGDGQSLADRTGIKVVTDFRTSDIKNGGQAAPLAPIYHWALAMRDDRIPIIIANCGGIANITIVDGEDPETDLIGFDTGPGNVLIDMIVRLRTKDKELMDRDGKYGSQGEINQEIMDWLYNNAVKKGDKNYLLVKYPKSLDTSDCHLPPEIYNISLQDACATLAAFTAYTIIDGLISVKDFDFATNGESIKLIISGGGWHNPVIVKYLKKYITEKNINIEIAKAQDLGFDSDTMEAEIFAFCAVRILYDLPISYHKTTGVDRIRLNDPMKTGKIYKPNLGK